MKLLLQKEKNNLTKDNQRNKRIGTVIKRDILENQANICFLAIGSNLGDKINNINSSKEIIRKNSS